MAQQSPQVMLLANFPKKDPFQSKARSGTRWLMSEKFDGWRLTYSAGTFYTREGFRLELPQDHPIASFLRACPPSFPLDGELYLGPGTAL